MKVNLNKRRAIILRKKGKSYNEISRILKVPKSTLSFWFKSVEWDNELIKKIWENKRKKWADNITIYNKKRAELARKKNLNIQEKSLRCIKKITDYELMLIGVALYWAEGAKRNRWAAVFVNSDSEMIKLIMQFFKEICKIPEEKFSFKIQIHPNISEKKSKLFWSKILNIKPSRFTKTLFQVSSASKGKRSKNLLPYGTCRISVSDVRLINKIQGWIRGIANQF